MKKLFALCALITIAACSREHAVAPPKKPKPAVAVATPMAPYKAEWLDGSPFDLASEKGHVVLLNVWATWCGPCRFEIPELGKLHAGRGFKVIGVSIDEGGAVDVKPFVHEQKIAYPIALDPEGKLTTILKTSVIPTSVVVDKAGNIVWKHFGVVSTSDRQLTEALESALAR
jgi:thiol-disulfide isomerase/thioredoxin